METLYDSDRFIVLHMQCEQPAPATTSAPFGAELLARHGFEIVDKHSGKQLYLDGQWSELFQRRIAEWRENIPTQQEVEDALAALAGLAQTPLALH